MFLWMLSFPGINATQEPLILNFILVIRTNGLGISTQRGYNQKFET